MNRRTATIIVRPATNKDAADLAIFDDMAGQGLSSLRWAQAARNADVQTALEFGREMVLNTEGPFGWKNAHIAEIDGEVAGGAIGYRGPDELGGIPDPFPAAVMRPIHELYRTICGLWWVDMLAVYSRFRRRGIARVLLENEIGRARTDGADRIALIVEDANTAAVTLYRALGFEVADRRPFVPFDERKKQPREWLALIAPVAA